MTIGRLTAADGAMGDATRARALSRHLRTAVLVLGGLASVVALRWAAIVDGRLDGITIGLAFGLALTLVGLGGSRLGGVPIVVASGPSPGLVVDGAVGIVGGAALVALALVARLAAPAGAVASTWLGPAAVFAPWLIATTIVALAE